jgi:hypothetical protein
MVDEEIAARFIGLGLTTTVYHGSRVTIPSGDGPFVKMQVYAGREPEYIHNNPTQIAFEFPRLQVLVIGRDVKLVRDKAWALYHASNVVNGTLSGVFYRRLRPLQNPFDLGSPDPNQRAQWVFNLEADKRPS